MNPTQPNQLTAEQYHALPPEVKANLIITKTIPSYAFLPYAFGENHIDQVIINGQPY